MTTNTMGRDEAGKAIRKRAMEGCPLARELLVLRGMCSCQGDEKSVDDAEDRYLELAVLRDAVPALQAEIEALRAEVERLNAELVRLEKIAGYGGLASDAPERLILASEVYDGIQSCDKWCDVRRVVDDGQPMPESATAYVRADRAERLAEALRWYAEQAQLCRKFGSEGDAARHALSADGGERANRALAQEDRNG